MKIQKISNYALYACFAIIALVFVLFYTVGYDNPVGEYNEPALTEGLLFLMYALVAICIVLMIWSAIKSAASGSGVDDAKTGVPGKKVAICAVAILIASLVLGAIFGSSAPVTAADGTVTEGTWSWISDIMIISIYILLAIAAVGIVVNLTGVIKNKN